MANGGPAASAWARAGTLDKGIGRVVAALAVAGTIALTGWSMLNGDVLYALGGMQTAGAGGVSIWDIFVARPVVYKLFVGGLDALTGRLPQAAQSIVIRAETDLIVVAVAVLLFFGVRRHAGPRAAAGVAVATGLALVVAPPWHFLEPDWVAPLAAVLAVGAALAPRRWWLGASLGGLAVMLVVAVKLATFPVALLALLVVAVLSLRRALWTTLSAVVLVALWYLVTKHFLPWEWIWLRDQANLVHNSPIHHGIRRSDLRRLQVSLGDVAVLSPIVVLAPASAAALIRRLPADRTRWLGGAVALVAGGLSVASAYGQGEFYMYHYAVVPVLAAGAWGAAFALCPHVRAPLALATVVMTAASFVLLSQHRAWRLAHGGAVAWAYEIIALLLAIVVWFWPRRGTLPWTVGVIALCGALVPASQPHAPYAFSTYDYQIHNDRPSSDWLAPVSRRLGPSTPVLYLTFGNVNYGLGNPTSCRYPSPQWLQRGTTLARVRGYRSYADNFRCLTETGDAKFAVIQRSWFRLDQAPPDVRALIDARFDCSPAAQVPGPRWLEICPAR